MEDEREPGRRDSEQVFAPSGLFRMRKLLPQTFHTQAQASQGRRSQQIGTNAQGVYFRAITPQGSARDIALAATLRAFALRHSHAQDTISHPPFTISPADLRVKLRRVRTANLILFIVDASGSMGARKRMMAVKGAVMSLLLEAYQKRDWVGLIAFRGQGAKILVPPTNSVDIAERQLRHLPTGGRTPLSAGLAMADQVLGQYTKRNAALKPLLVLITDGRVNAGPSLKSVCLSLVQHQVSSLVLDSESGLVRLGVTQQIAIWLKAKYVALDDLQPEQIVGQVKRVLRAKLTE